MIGVAKNDLRAEAIAKILEVAMRHAFDGTLRANRHEGGRVDGAVGRLHAATARGAILSEELELE